MAVVLYIYIGPNIHVYSAIIVDMTIHGGAFMNTTVTKLCCKLGQLVLMGTYIDKLKGQLF